MINIETIREYPIVGEWEEEASCQESYCHGSRNVIYRDPADECVFYRETTYAETKKLQRHTIKFIKGVCLITIKTAGTCHDEYGTYTDFDVDVAEYEGGIASCLLEALEYMIEMIVATIEERLCSEKEDVRKNLRRELLSEKCV